MKRIREFFTADWHLGHENVIKFSSRPFKNADEMAEGLIKRYNSRVEEEDICYFLGDFSMANVEDSKTYLSRLNGRKILILGNHDRGSAGMYKMGFDAVLYRADLIIAKERVTLTHCPLRGIYREDITGMRGTAVGENWHGESRQLDFSCENNGQFHLHGHIHSPNGGRSDRELGRQYDVGLDANNYMPVSRGTIESFICRIKRSENETD